MVESKLDVGYGVSLEEYIANMVKESNNVATNSFEQKPGMVVLIGDRNLFEVYSAFKQHSVIPTYILGKDRLPKNLRPYKIELDLLNFKNPILRVF